VTPAVGDVASTPAIEDAPVPGELKKLTVDSPTQEAIDDTDPAPVVKKKAVAKPKASEDKKVATRSLGAKPVVLVPAARKPVTGKKQKLQNETSGNTEAVVDGGGLYGGADFTTANTEAAPVVSASPVKKKKTLADLFSGDEASPPQAPAALAEASEPSAPVKPAVKKPQIVAPGPEQQASLGNGFSVQLASFRSRNEATTEFSRLKAKHAATLGRFSPIISEAQVGGSTRYRLSVGGMSSQAQASAVCSSLFAGGERDCLVKRP
jgi:hypothetical protein